MRTYMSCVSVNIATMLLYPYCYQPHICLFIFSYYCTRIRLTVNVYTKTHKFDSHFNILSDIYIIIHIETSHVVKLRQHRLKYKCEEITFVITAIDRNLPCSQKIQAIVKVCLKLTEYEQGKMFATCVNYVRC